MALSVVINEVGPRDGLQNQPIVLDLDQRRALITALIEAGLPAIEIGALVSPRAVPAMADSDRLAALLPVGNTVYSALIPNAKGYQRALAAGLENLVLVVAASERMNQQNIAMATDQAMAVVSNLATRAAGDGVSLDVYIATAWECPFEGPIDAERVLALSEQCIEWGVRRVVLADTIGAADPAAAAALAERHIERLGAERLGCHFHATRGFGVANVYAAFQVGVRRFDAAIAGLGGCPFAPGASGNVATEDVVLLFEQMGLSTGIDLHRLVAAADLAEELLGSHRAGQSLSWLRHRRSQGLLATGQAEQRNDQSTHLHQGNQS